MKCFYHAESDAVGTCKYCHKGICKQCAKDIGIGIVCNHDAVCETRAIEINNVVDRNVKFSKNRSFVALYAVFFFILGAFFIYHAATLQHVGFAATLHYYVGAFLVVFSLMFFARFVKRK